jgi:hypothetical protein
MTKEFGEIKLVDIRDIWDDEAREFTPWLAKNIAGLGEALGLEIELLSTEAPVGGFAVDILARDLNRDLLVVIESQLSVTNHDHLGKLLTYASGYDAGIVIWVATEFRDEHRQALDWLNQRTDIDTDFFGVIVELLKIDDSRPAFRFRSVVAPNEWRKERVGSAGGRPSARGEAYRAFYQELIDELREHHRFTGARLAQPQSWYSFASGFSGITYNAAFVLNDRARTELYIDVGEESRNKEIFDRLARASTELEAQFGEKLAWERLDGKRASRVGVYRPGNIEMNPQDLTEVRNWFVDRLLKLKKAFGPKLTEALR